MTVLNRGSMAALLVLSAGAMEAAAQEDAAARLEKRVQTCSRYITDRFVFFGGGSGVLISADGYCLTNHHVAGMLKTARVTLHDGRRREARRICTDVLGDLALFKIEAKEGETFSFAPWGDSDALEAGQYVMACGNPFGLALPTDDRKLYPAISLGIVSALHRNQGAYFDCIQTDAAVNPGNSGGPLVTLDGKLVGINGRIATRFANRVNSGVGYAIPSRQVRNFLPEMMKGGTSAKVYHGQITGLVLSDNPTEGRGASIRGVRPGSTAERAGFHRGDLIVKVENYSIPGPSRFLGAIGTWPKGAEITVHIKRGKETRQLKVKLDRFVGANLMSWMRGAPKDAGGYLGLSAAPGDVGVEVVLVSPGSPADLAGIRKGDRILKVENRGIATPTELRVRIGSRRPGTEVTLTIRRGENRIELVVKLGKRPKR